MDKTIAELIRISNTVGRDKTLVQGGGGNTSVKTSDGKYMYIKTSGTALKDMDARNGWRRLRLESTLGILKDASLARLKPQEREVEVVRRLAKTCDDNITTNARPSVEANLHAILDKCVIHLHPIAVGAYVNAKNGRAILEKLFKNEKFPPLWVSYADPGLTLAKKIQKLAESYQIKYGRRARILFLEKHGLFATAATPNAALKIVRDVIGRCSAKLKEPPKANIKLPKIEQINDVKLTIRKAFFKTTGQYQQIRFFPDATIASYSKVKNLKALLSKPALTPDELVYANGPALWLEEAAAEQIAKKLFSQIQSGQKSAHAFIVRGIGLFVAAKEKKADIIKEVVDGSLFIRYNASRMGGILPLSKRERDFINDWEAEAFRQKVSGGASEGILKGRIAIVTGAGSGLGRSIAAGLAQAGAAVAIADIDKTAAQETAKLIEESFSNASTKAISCDVTDEKSVDEAFNEVLNKWGGLDILVNAAGVAPAYPLVDLPADKWRLTLEVNLTGYFLMAKAASRIMIKQQMDGNIINISSKSGIAPSKNNTPYNATKAGELHMGRGWAMELGEYGIRVNSICPGNVFEGSKIWNPEYIRVCAKKYGIRPEEVIPYYVNKTMLKREIKGQDIADTVVFLASDKAKMITGQTLVVDAGQVMVR